MYILEIENLSLQYGKQEILRPISFSVKKGEIVGLLGPNGAGKTSIIKILAGLVYPKTGKLIFENTSCDNFSELRNHCGYLIDYPSFYPFLSAKQNLNLIKSINNCDAEVEILLEKVGLKEVGKKRVKYFSTGMKQRLAIAQSMLRDPEILILDEPFSGLDPNGFHDLINLLDNLNKNGTTIIVSSHLLHDLEQFADSFILLHRGDIALNISKKELLKSKKRVAFTFEQSPSGAASDFISKMNANFENSKRVVLHLNPNEIASVVNELVNLKCTPINVETLTILQEKYLEITI
jgi:ABC-2 type transport system ATP-binding protein